MYGSSVNFGGLSQQAFKTTPNPIFDRLAQQNQAYQNQLASRSQQIQNLESMNATSPFQQLKKYIWASNEQATPQVQTPQPVYASQPQQQAPMQIQQPPQQQQMPEWMQYSKYSAPMNYYQQPNYYQQQPLNYGYGQQYLW